MGFPERKTHQVSRKRCLFSAILLSCVATAVLSLAPFAGCAMKVIHENTSEEATEARNRPKEQLAEKVDDLRKRVGDLAARIHQLTNEQRRRHGIRALEWDADLAAIAYKHSLDMARRNYFDHVTPEGKNFTDRYHENGYHKNTRVGDLVYGGAENLFLNNIVRSYTYDKDTGEIYSYEFSDLEEIAESTVEGWMQSPGHRENILTPFTREGIGIYVNDDGKVYITQNFS